MNLTEGLRLVAPERKRSPGDDNVGEGVLEWESAGVSVHGADAFQKPAVPRSLEEGPKHPRINVGVDPVHPLRPLTQLDDEIAWTAAEIDSRSSLSRNLKSSTICSASGE